MYRDRRYIMKVENDLTIRLNTHMKIQILKDISCMNIIYPVNKNICMLQI